MYIIKIIFIIIYKLLIFNCFFKINVLFFIKLIINYDLSIKYAITSF